MQEYQNRMEPHREIKSRGRRPTAKRWPNALDHAVNKCPSPQCGSTQTRCYKTENMTKNHVKRLYKCMACGLTFETHQELPAIDAKE